MSFFPVRRAPRRVACLVSVFVLTWAPSVARALEAPAPDLRVEAWSDAPASLGVGDRVTHRLTVTNRGEGVATDVVIVEALPTGLRPLSAHVAGDAWCELTSILDSEGNEVGSAWCHVGILEPGATVTATIRAEVSPTGGCRTLRSAVAVSSPDEPRAALGRSNRAAIAETVGCTCGIDLDARLRDEVRAGATARGLFVVRNLGDGRALVSLRTAGTSVGDRWVAPGSRRLIRVTWAAPTSSRTTVLTAVAVATLPDGTTCRDLAREEVLVAGGRAAPPPSPGGTPFTGTNIGVPWAAAACLTLVGVVSLLFSRRRGR